jgi:hypothetical protein
MPDEIPMQLGLLPSAYTKRESAVLYFYGGKARLRIIRA